MKHKRLLQKFSITTTRMMVRRELSLPVKIIVWSLPLALTLGAYGMGRNFAGTDLDVRSLFTKPRAELNTERATRNQLQEQIKVLEAENARLKEDLAHFNNLLPTNTSVGTSGIAIQKLALEPVTPNQLRFRTLLKQDGNSKQRFSGNLQIVVTAQQGDQTVDLVFPNDKSTDHDNYKIGFKYFQELEGVLTLPDSTTVKSVQVRIMENGQVRALKVTEAVSKTNQNT